ncbi:MAG: porin [Gemmatimonadales bacterium]
MQTQSHTIAAALGSILLATAAQALHAQVEFHSKALAITVTGRVHSQFATTSVDGERSSQFLIRRARLTAEVEVNEFISGKIQPDYGEGEVNLKDAYVRLEFSPTFRVTAGQFKRPFDLFELTSSTQILVIERAGGIDGLNSCSGPGGLCSLSRFTEKLQYSDRDIGVKVDGKTSSGKFSYAASITNGTGANAADTNGTKSYTGRVGFSPKKGVSFGANVGVHDYVRPGTTDNDYGTAVGGDIEIGSFDSGLHIRGGVVGGDNWKKLIGTDPSTFVSTQGIVSYKAGITGSPYVTAVEPVARFSYGDPDTDAPDDDGWLFTPGFVLHFTGRNKIAANIDIWSPSAGSTELSVKVQSYLHF